MADADGPAPGAPAPDDGGTKPDAVARLKRFLRPALLVLAVVSVAAAGYDLALRWQAQPLTIQPVWALLAAPPLLVATLIQGCGWVVLLEAMVQRRVPFGPALALHAESQLARYTPGKLGLPLVRIAGADDLGVPGRAVGASVLIEVSTWLGGGSAVGLALLALTAGGAAREGVLGHLGHWAIPALASVAIGLTLLTILDRRRFPGRLLAAVKLEGAGPLVPPAFLAIHLVHWGCWGLHGYLMSRAVGAPHGSALASAGAYVLAPLAGFLMLATPAGVGVREAFLSLGLAALLGGPGALAAAIASRVASVSADVGGWLVTRPLAARGRAR